MTLFLQDVLVYEAPLLRNVTNSSGPLLVMDGADIRSSLQLSRSSYLDFILLLGTDFSQRIKNVGPTRALKFIREHGSIERILAVESKYPPRSSSEEYLNQVNEARAVFSNLPPLPSPDALVQGTPDDTQVADLMRQFRLTKAFRAIVTKPQPEQELDPELLYRRDLSRLSAEYSLR